MTLNIGSLFEPEWGRRAGEVVAWIDHVNPDVVCLQEVHGRGREPDVGQQLADAAAGQWHSVFGGGVINERLQPDPTVRFGSAILSRWPIEFHELHLLPFDLDAVSDDDPFPALMPWELLHAHTAGLDVFSTHLAPAPHHGLHRRLQVLAIDDIVRSSREERDAFVDFPRQREHMPAVLCGDFNAEPDSDEIRFLRGATVLDGRTTFWQDAWRVGGDGSAGHTQDWRTHPLAALLNVHRKRIDYVFVGDPFMREGGGGRVISAQVICDSSLTGVKASDHCGVLVELHWPQRPEE